MISFKNWQISQLVAYIVSKKQKKEKNKNKSLESVFVFMETGHWLLQGTAPVRDLYRTRGRRRLEEGYGCWLRRRGLGEHGVGSADAHQVVSAEGSSHGGSAQIFVLILTQSGDRLQIRNDLEHALSCSSVAPPLTWESNMWLESTGWLTDSSLPQVSERARCLEAPEENSGCCRLPASADQSNTWRRHWLERWCWTAEAPGSASPSRSW